MMSGYSPVRKGKKKMKNEYSFLKESMDWETVERDDFCSKLAEVLGMKQEDFWSDRDWLSLARGLKREALLCMPSDTASGDIRIEAIMKSYWSGIPQLVQLATEIGEFIIKYEPWKTREVRLADKPLHFEKVMLLGYMSLLGAFIEKFALKKDVYSDIDDNLENKER